MLTLEKFHVSSGLISIAAMVLVGQIAAADLVSPQDVPYHSPEYVSGDNYGVGDMIDEIFGPGASGYNSAVILDDTPSDLAATGHVVFDLGAAIKIDGAMLWSRSISAESGNAFSKNADFFYFDDDDPSNNALVDDIEGDADIVGIWSNELTYRVSGDVEEVAFGSSLTKRYIGLRLNDSWDPTPTIGERGNQIQEVMFYQDQVLEPNWMPPADVPYHSPEYVSGENYGVGDMQDGIYGPVADVYNSAVILDDTPLDLAATGYVVFDLGSAKEIDAVKLWSRNITAENSNAFPKDIDFFYFTDDDPSNNALVDDIDGDADIVSILSDELTYRVSGDVEEVAFDSSLTKRYIGLRLNDSWDPTTTIGERGNQIQEIMFRLVNLLPGDANLDGTVDDADAATLASNWLSGPDATWAQGDFNNDGMVNDIDATLLAVNWTTAASASVPEPSALAALLGLLLGALFVRTKTC